MAGCIRSMASRVTVLDQKQKVDAANRLQQRWQRWELSNYEYLMLVTLWSCCPLVRLLFKVGLSRLGASFENASGVQRQGHGQACSGD